MSSPYCAKLRIQPAKAGKTPSFPPLLQSWECRLRYIGKTPKTYPPPLCSRCPKYGLRYSRRDKKSYHETYDSSNSQFTLKSFNLNAQEKKKKAIASQLFVVLVCFAVLFSLVMLIKISKTRTNRRRKNQ